MAFARLIKELNAIILKQGNPDLSVKLIEIIKQDTQIESFENPTDEHLKTIMYSRESQKISKIVILSPINEYTVTNFNNYPYKEPFFLIKSLKTNCVRIFYSDQDWTPYWTLNTYITAIDANVYDKEIKNFQKTTEEFSSKNYIINPNYIINLQEYKN